MIYLPDGSRRYSPSDLIAYLEGDFAAWMERRQAEGKAGRTSLDFPFAPDEADAERELVAGQGAQHEAAVLAVLRARLGDCEEIPSGDQSVDQTFAAMRGGRRLIYQGHLTAGEWHGYPDFLVRTDSPSQLGAWAYWPVDSKLARSAKPYFLIQLSAYAEFLQHVQGLRPRQLGFVFGNRLEQAFDTERYFFFYRYLKEAFDRFQETFDPDAMPDPALESGYGGWTNAARRILVERDDPRLVARITISQIKRLRDAGIRTCTELIASGAVPRINSDVLDRIRRQARLQVASRGKRLPEFEVLPPDVAKRAGLAALPPASDGDVYFDLEGFPLAENGLEYLFGAVTVRDGTPQFHDWWAHDAAQEKAAFENVVDWLHKRWKADPAMHIYHYAPYEVNALRRLMGRYATRETEVDDLLRGEVFVDLLSVTRAAVAIGTSGYSLKDIEVLFSPARKAGVTDAGSSIVEYQRWMDSGEPGDWQYSATLSAIRDYNREDCEATWRLAGWLRGLQSKAGIRYLPIEARPEEPQEARPEDAVADLLLARAATEPDPERKRVTQLVGWLLNYHRREEKPMWWRYFDRLQASEEELFNDADCLAGLARTVTPATREKRSLVAEYGFDPDQDTKIQEGDKVYVVTADAVPNEVVTFDADRGLLTLKFGPTRAIPDSCSLIPNEYVSSEALRDAVFRFAERWQQGDIASVQAIDDLLFRRPPRLKGGPRSILFGDGAQLPEDLVGLAQSLDHTTLCIQGPPGSGKTYNAAAVIVALSGGGARIGVSSNSHKAIVNLLDAVTKEAKEQEREVPIAKVGNDQGEIKSKDVAGVLRPGIVVGGTAWVFGRPDLEQQFDYLFVDEAGQVALANAIAMGLAARNIVLIGDQMQLAQPAQGSHPGQSGLSCLHYLLEGHATVPPDRGVLLPITWRLHPDICQFISDTAYDGRLKPEARTSRRRVILSPDSTRLRRGTGIHFEELRHEGNTQSSEEEAERIAEVLGDLDRSEIQVDGNRSPFDREKDLLVVAPYNAQVRCLKHRLGDRLRIASVDKFQGQEASVVIVSMCASSLEEAARGSAFLLSPNRLNVAISRAKCLAIVVASATLIRTRPTSVAELELLNLFCRLRYYARDLDASRTHV
ncbi:MAG TPA: TM0106 family RecB-like putative nuclease [Propionibacteriaceae bacterium]|nr:TM0106 family RecB-like putative nuclease [Propionibacteriaceae bacterium]